MSRAVTPTTSPPRTWCRLPLHVTLLLALLAAAPTASPAPFQIYVDTSALRGTAASIAFDFIDGGAPANMASVVSFSTDATLGASSLTGDAAGFLTGTIRLGDASFFNEYLQDLVLGGFFTFILELSGNPPFGLSMPDAFSLFLLDANGVSLVSTSDPTGADAVLVALADGSSPQSYNGPDFSVRISAVPIAAVPTPDTPSLILLGLALMAMFALRMRRERIL